LTALEAIDRLNRAISYPRIDYMPQHRRIVTPWGYVGKLREERFRRQQEELKSYLEVAVPVALLAERLYAEWREAVAEPIQNVQKAANVSAVYWWQITNELGSFEPHVPPRIARRYHKLFVDALKSASRGTAIAKNGFRFHKFSMVGSGMELMDRYVELMAKAENEIVRLVSKYRLIDEEETKEASPATPGESGSPDGTPL
jgi:hypothetical protein